MPNTPSIGTAVDVGIGRPYGNGAITVSFYPSTTGGTPYSYTVTSYPGLLTATGGLPSLTVTGLTGNTFYSFNAVASSSSGYVTPTTLSTTQTLATTVPSAPTIGVISSQDGRDDDDGAVTVTLSSSSGGKPVSYYTVTASPSGLVKTGLSPLVFNGLPGGASSTFTATATNANGTSTSTTYGSPVTPLTKPAAPVLDTLTAGTNKITAAFHPQSDGGSAILYYIITYSASDEPAYDAEYSPKTVTTTSSPYAILNLRSGYTYHISVQAVNKYGASLSSNTRSRTV